MRERLDTSKLNWKWLFLPGNKALEELYREYLHVPENLEKFCEIVGKEKKQIITMLATIDGNDYHDDQKQNDNYPKTIYQCFIILIEVIRPNIVCCRNCQYHRFLLAYWKL